MLTSLTDKTLGDSDMVRQSHHIYLQEAKEPALERTTNLEATGHYYSTKRPALSLKPNKNSFETDSKMIL